MPPFVSRWPRIGRRSRRAGTQARPCGGGYVPAKAGTPDGVGVVIVAGKARLCAGPGDLPCRPRRSSVGADPRVRPGFIPTGKTIERGDHP